MAKIKPKELVYAVALTLVLQSSTANAQNVLDGTFAVLGRALQPNVTNPTNPLENVTAQCYWDTAQFMGDLLASDTYASRMYFSSGSFRNDYEFTWNVKDVGDYTMCRTTDPRESLRSFTSKYCLTETTVHVTYSITMAVCFPNSCTEEDIQLLVLEGYKEGFPFGELSPWASTTTLCSYDYPFTAGDIVACLICITLLIVITMATIYDVVQRRKQKPWEVVSTDDIVMDVQDQNKDVATPGTEANDHPVMPEISVEEPAQPSRTKNTKENKSKMIGVLLAFSALDTGSKILNTTPSKGSISCLNAIRVLSMFWIILYHIWLLLASSSTFVENPRQLHEMNADPKSAILRYGELGVEAFFVLGGLLVSYVTLKNFDKFGKPRNPRWWLLFFLHRYWRLTPAYALVLLIYCTVLLHMNNGIWWIYIFGSQKICHATWWANLLYVNNLYPSECMGWSWYLAVDMQLYLISPIFIILFYKKWRVGLIVSVVTTLCSFAISAGLLYGLGRTMGDDDGPYGDPTISEGPWLYTKPYYRISQYLIGIGLGYVLYRLKGKKVKINKILNVFLWCCSTLIALLVIYGPYMKSGEDPRPQGVAILYLSIHRFLLSACIGWVIFACATGNGGPVNTLLSWNGWLPLARVNYCAYLLHLIVIMIYAWGLKRLWFYSYLDMTLVFIGITAITYAGAFLVTMAIEIPMIGVEKVLMPNREKKAYHAMQDNAQTPS